MEFNSNDPNGVLSKLVRYSCIALGRLYFNKQKNMCVLLVSGCECEANIKGLSPAYEQFYFIFV
jgi:hypothetical protein